MERRAWSQSPSPKPGLVCASEKGVTACLSHLAGWFLLEASGEGSRKCCFSLPWLSRSPAICFNVTLIYSFYYGLHAALGTGRSMRGRKTGPGEKTALHAACPVPRQARPHAATDGEAEHREDPKQGRMVPLCLRKASQRK